MKKNEKKKEKKNVMKKEKKNEKKNEKKKEEKNEMKKEKNKEKKNEKQNITHRVDVGLGVTLPLGGYRRDDGSGRRVGWMKREREETDEESQCIKQWHHIDELQRSTCCVNWA